MPRGMYFFLFPLMIGGCLAFYIAGLKQGRQQHALEETKLLVNSLTQKGGRDLNPQFREYAKGRVYWNTYLYISTGWAEGLVKDFGEVKESLLGTAQYRKEPADHRELRKGALKKAGLPLKE